MRHTSDSFPFTQDWAPPSKRAKVTDAQAPLIFCLPMFDTLPSSFVFDANVCRGLKSNSGIARQ
jgi:hypothetical protein